MNALNTLRFLQDNSFDIDLIDLENQADINTREKFGVNEPVNKWDGYYIGDADEEALNEIAKKHNLEDYDELFTEMDSEFENEFERLASEKLESLDNFTLEVEKTESDYPYDVANYIIYTNNREHAIEEFEDFELVEEHTSYEGLYRFKKTDK